MSVKTKIKTTIWSLLGLCCVALLVAAMKAKDAKACSNIEININGVVNNMFIKKVDVVDVLSRNSISAGQTLSDINLKNAEQMLEKNAWIRDAELFFDNHQMLHVHITEREPLARVFTVNGHSFYIDSTGMRLPVNENAAARLIVFTSFPSDKPVLSKPDSLVLDDVKRIAQYISADSFLNAQTAQVNITPQRTYEITPVVGGQLIKIGNGESLDEKFAKLMAFYKQVFSKSGFEKYSMIDVQYEGQVVAVRKGEGYTIPSDTAKAMQQLAKADMKLSKALSDTTYTASLSKPVKVDAPVAAPAPKFVERKPVTKKPVVKTNKKTVKNADGNNNRKKQQERKPKAVMKKKV
ncbi:cell division protein FtsQ/DivIB [Parafilimonas sp.]|uniref:cell division protein FtsQ/DivIB n=1 Tax=Parafilimonas sp. TaxID=1969739 RepID=UPI0039E4F0F5